MIEADVERGDEAAIFFLMKASDDSAMGAAKNARDFAGGDIAIAHAARIFLHSNDDEIAVHRSFDRPTIDMDVRLSLGAAHGAVAVGMHANESGMIRRELEKRIALAANGDDRAVALELLDGELDFFARGIVIGKAFPDFFDAEQTTAALPEKVDDRLLKIALLQRQRALHSTRLLVRWRADALRRHAAARGPNRFCETVQHGLRAQLVVQRVAVNAERFRSLRNVAATGRHCCHDVLPLKGFHCLFEGDAVSD